jgi:tetratricopeptide (TPR) repeat protein
VIAAGALRAHFEERVTERRALISWAIATLAFGALIHADNAAHLGGMGAGALFGLAFRRAAPSDSESSTLPGGILILAALGAFGTSIALRNRADTAPGLVNHGVDLARSDDHEGAIAAYRRAITLEPNDAIAHYDLGLSLEEIGDYDQAIVHLTRAYELDPSSDHRDALVSAHANHATNLFEKGEKLAAIAAYRRAIAIDGNNARTHTDLGLALLAVDEYLAAISELRLALGIQPDSQKTKESLARALGKEGMELEKQEKRGEAIARYREAVGLNADAWESHYLLGVALGKEHDANGAVSELETAFRLQPSEGVRSALADAIEARGDAHADAGALGAALDDMGSATVLRLRSIDGGAQAPAPTP